jgi:hypothetical protein
MPPGVAVVDAFKSLFFLIIDNKYLSDLTVPYSDLIRHGKNHIHVRQDELPSSQLPAVPTTDLRSQPERRQHADVQPLSQPKQQQPNKAQPATTKQSQQLTREVEKIVREEREAMEKLPAYKGLERFRLVEKKGECVIFTRPILTGWLTVLILSGAFSNVYKALDVTSGMSVAGMPSFSACYAHQS